MGHFIYYSFRLFLWNEKNTPVLNTTNLLLQVGLQLEISSPEKRIQWFFASVHSFPTQVLLKGFWSYPNDFGREEHNIWLKYCCFFQSLWCSCERSCVTRQAKLDHWCDSVEIGSIPDPWQGDGLSVNAPCPSSLLGGCHSRAFLVLFSPAAGVWVVALPKVRHIFHRAGFCEPLEAPHRGCREQPPSPSGFLGRGEREQQAEHARWLLMAASSFPWALRGLFIALKCLYEMDKTCSLQNLLLGVLNLN